MLNKLQTFNTVINRFLKTILSFSAVIFSFLQFFSCSSKKTSDTVEKEITLVMAEVNPPDSVVGLMDQEFKRKVEELSGGKMK